MTQEEKDLLLKDLCARLFSNTITEHPYLGKGILSIRDIQDVVRWVEVKPYLRPVSSMTGEEKKEMHELLSPEGTARYDTDGIRTPVTHYGDFISYEYMGKVIAYLLSKHFDINNLIPKGLAIEVTEENNPYNQK